MTIQEISDTSMVESNLDAHGEPNEPHDHMTATVQPDPAAKIEFHVQMRSWTQESMEELIVDAAARQLVRSFGEREMQKKVEERCMALITERIDAHLAGITAEIIDQPLTPNFGDKKPVTMREFLGLYAREYLDQHVDRDGKPSKPDGWRSSTEPRIQRIIAKHLDHKFKNEIERATNAAISEIQAAVSARHKEIVTAEKKRLSDALAKAVSP